MATDFQSNLQEPSVPESEIINDINDSKEKEYFDKLKKKHKKFLIKLNFLERERIAQHIIDLYDKAKPAHDELCTKLDEWDDVYKMKRKTLPGADDSMPNYRTPISATTHEIVHANVMNVFFTPKETVRALPTEPSDMEKIDKLTTFANWSAVNELKLFERCDRLFHSSEKNGECPYIVHWVREYGTEIKREVVMNPANPREPLVDEDTKEPIYQEIEEEKLLYNGPKLEVFSRKDYIQPEDATMDEISEWDIRMARISYDDFLREKLMGKMYEDSLDKMKGIRSSSTTSTVLTETNDDVMNTDDWNNKFIEFYGRMRIQAVKDDAEDELDDTEELQDEFIAIVHISSGTLCQLRKNKFPMKERPIGVDYFIPNDEGKKVGYGIYEFMDSIQKTYDALYNQYILGVVQSNNPIGFFTPFGNMRQEPLKVQYGYMYPMADANSIKMMDFPAPNQSIQLILDLVRNWAQMLFGISDYAAGLESQTDPSAPAAKAELVVAQGSVRLNMIIKRKNKTIQDIMRRWFLLYKENMPANKYMRIVGEDKDNPFKFESVSYTDFALKSIPDFELTGNILNVNKSLEANKAIAIYNLFIANPFFAPSTRQGMMALHGLTKWLADKLDEIGLSRFVPKIPGEIIHTPEEENARFMQGDTVSPMEGEDHVAHLKVHQDFLMRGNIPEEVAKIVVQHIKETVAQMKVELTQQMVMQQGQMQGGQGMPQGQLPPQGGMNVGSPNDQVTQGPPQGMVFNQPGGMGNGM